MVRSLVWIVLATCIGTATADNLPIIQDTPQTIDPASLLPEDLIKPVSGDFKESSLRELVEWLREKNGLSVLVHERALHDAGVSLAEPVSDHIDNQPLYLLLNRLQQIEVAWYMEKGMLHLTSDEDAHARIVTQAYNVGDLIDTGLDVDSLIDAITSTIATDTWAENGGGEGEIRAIGDVLFVSQNDRVLGGVAALLEALRHHGRQTLVGEPTLHGKIREQLGKPVSVDFNDTPLLDAIAELSAKSEIDIRLDRPALAEIRLRDREPVTLTLSDRPVETVLQAILSELELAWIIDRGVLQVTSLDREQSQLKVAVYDVRDLCRDDDEAEALLEAITAQTDSASWAQNGGGEADIRSATPGTLVVSQREHAHVELLALLEAYREALRSSKDRAAPDNGDELTTVYYRTYTGLASDLTKLLPAMAAPDTWGGEGETGAWIVIATSKPLITQATDKTPFHAVEQSTLIVRNKRRVQTEIAKFISRVESGDQYGTMELPTKGGLGGGGGGFGGGFFSIPNTVE
jgi:hypothetical protein